MGTPSSNNSTLDIIIKKSFETESYLNQVESNSEYAYESDEFQFLSDDDFENVNEETRNNCELSTNRVNIKDDLCIGDTLETNVISNEDLTLIRKISNKSIKRFPKEFHDISKITIRNSDGNSVKLYKVCERQQYVTVQSQKKV